MSNYFESNLIPEDRGRLSPSTTVPDFLTLIQTYEKQIAFEDTTTQKSYTELCYEVGQIRSILAAQGFRKGDNIAIWMPNGIFAAEAFLAIASYGGCAVVFPAALPVPALQGFAAKFDIKGMFCAPSNINTAKEALPQVVLMDDNCAGQPYAPSAMVQPEDAAAIFLTGGTTGIPKGAVLSHRALLRGAYNGALVPDGMFGHVSYAILPFCHVFGMIRSVLSFLYTGSKVCICSGMKMIFNELPVYQPDTLILVPGLADVLLQVMKMKGAAAHGGNLRTIISGAAPVPQKTIEAFCEYGVKMMGGYGLTETANFVSGNLHPLEKPGSVGKLYSGGEVELREGEICVRGDHVMTKYYNDPEETARVLCDGWLRTGDLGRFDEDGFLYITGRIKNLIILGNGENVAPEEIEYLLYAQPAVKDCLVKEMDSSIGVEIQLLPSEFPGADQAELELEARRIVQKINAQLPAYKHISKVVLRMEDFEKTGSMKVKRI